MENDMNFCIDKIVMISINNAPYTLTFIPFIVLMHSYTTHTHIRKNDQSIFL